MTVSTPYLGYGQVASMLQILPGTVRTYYSQGRMPSPDVMVGKTPGWKPETITAWVDTRPGKGARTDRLERNQTNNEDS